MLLKNKHPVLHPVQLIAHSSVWLYTSDFQEKKNHTDDIIKGSKPHVSITMHLV